MPPSRTRLTKLRHFKTLAISIRDNSKGKALLTALDKAFAELDRLGAATKAIISLNPGARGPPEPAGRPPYGDGIVLFNGTNSDSRAGHLQGLAQTPKAPIASPSSKTADTRAALVEALQERGTVMIAHQAGAEGINLQFCSLVINLRPALEPCTSNSASGVAIATGRSTTWWWVNFVDRSNEADARVATNCWRRSSSCSKACSRASDRSARRDWLSVDFERRIADIYQELPEPK